ncbi:NAD dependent epimerase/dehydratase [Xylariaceae sp. FL0594]|nr:NAD dependent epimerase/dehydratase [Xylariaceae sp. FL0594]
MSPPHHVLLLGGNGKVARLLTPMLLRRSWAVTSIIRDPEQVPSIKKLAEGLEGEGKEGLLDVRVWSIEEEATSVEKCRELIDEVKPDYVVWSAGAAGKGAPERTDIIDRDAAINFIRASASTITSPSSVKIRKFILISFLTSRVQGAPWWTPQQWRDVKEGELFRSLRRYYEAKVAADRVLYEESLKFKHDGNDIAFVSLRPGLLTTEPIGGVKLGKTPETSGTSSRASVAYLTAKLLDTDGLHSCYLDMLDGDEDPDEAVKRVVEEGVDCAEGEPYFILSK